MIPDGRMEEVMRRRTRTNKLITLAILILVAGMSLLGARTIASETLTIHAYIPERTTVDFSESAELIFLSNNPAAALAVSHLQGGTILSVVAR